MITAIHKNGVVQTIDTTAIRPSYPPLTAQDVEAIDRYSAAILGQLAAAPRLIGTLTPPNQAVWHYTWAVRDLLLHGHIREWSHGQHRVTAKGLSYKRELDSAARVRAEIRRKRWQSRFDAACLTLLWLTVAGAVVVVIALGRGWWPL